MSITDVFPVSGKVVAIAEPTKGYTLARWDMAASSRVINGKPDVTVAFSWTPCRILSDGTLEEASASKAEHRALSSIYDAKTGALTPLGQALLEAVKIAISE